MKNYEEELATAIRIEHDESSDEVFIVFKVSNQKFKKEILKTWSQDIEFVVKNKKIYFNHH